MIYTLQDTASGCHNIHTNNKIWAQFQFKKQNLNIKIPPYDGFLLKYNYTLKQVLYPLLKIQQACRFRNRPIRSKVMHFKKWPKIIQSELKRSHDKRTVESQNWSCTTAWILNTGYAYYFAWLAVKQSNISYTNTSHPIRLGSTHLQTHHYVPKLFSTG